MGLYSIVLNYGEPSITVDGLHRPALIDGWTDGELAEVAADDDPPEDWIEADDLAIDVKHEEERMTTTWTVSRLPRAPQTPPQAEPVPAPTPQSVSVSSPKLYKVLLKYGEPRAFEVKGVSRIGLVEDLPAWQLEEMAHAAEPPWDLGFAKERGKVHIADHDPERKRCTWIVERPVSTPRLMSEADIAQVALSAHDHAGCFITRGGLELLVAGLRPDLEPPGVAEFGARVESLLPADVVSTTFNGADMYQTLAAEFSLASGDAAPLQAALGVAEEAGEVAGLFKRLFREDYPEVPSEKLAEELGDLIWYVAELARVSGLSLSDIMLGNIAKLERRKAAGNIRGTGDR